MKNVTVFLLLIVIFAGCGSATKTITKKDPSRTEPAAVPENLETRVYSVYGMTCSGCENTLKAQVSRIPAVHSSEASFKKELLTVKVKPRRTLSDEDIFKAVKMGKFTPGKRKK